MAGQLIPPPELAPPRQRLTPQQGLALWVDLMHACEQFLLAGLRRKVGPDGDVQAAYREWYARQMEEHDRMIIHMCEEFSRRSRREKHSNGPESSETSS